MVFVLDASIAVRWFLVSQATSYSSFVLKRAAVEKVHVPAIFPIETAGILLKELNKGTISTSDADRFLQLMDVLEISTKPSIADMRMLFANARYHRLAPADASYVQLAVDLRIPLASADDKMCNAALEVGLELLAPS